MFVINTFIPKSVKYFIISCKMSFINVLKCLVLPLICTSLWFNGIVAASTVKVIFLVFFFYSTVVPIGFKYATVVQRNLVFLNFVKYPRNVALEDPSSVGLRGTRNVYIEFTSRHSPTPVKLGIWHMLPEMQADCIQSKEISGDDEYLTNMFNRMLARNGKGIIFYLHGNSNNRAAFHRVRLYELLQKMDYHIIAFDYRSFGDSTKTAVSESAVVEDAHHVYRWLHGLLEEQLQHGGVTNRPPVFLWGHSLGTGVSAHFLSSVANRQTVPEKLPLPVGVILESPFSNMAEEVAEHPFSKIFKWLPHFHWSFVVPFVESPDYSFRSDSFLSEEVVRKVPLMVLHAQDDRIIPYHLGVKLFQSVVESRKDDSAVEIPTVMHSFPSELGLGHRWVCNAPDLKEIVDNFVETAHSCSNYLCSALDE